MPDISMCQNTGCPKRHDCYRYLAIPNEHMQTYGHFLIELDGSCDYQWKVEGVLSRPIRPVEEVDAEIIQRRKESPSTPNSTEEAK